MNHLVQSKNSILLALLGAFLIANTSFGQIDQEKKADKQPVHLPMDPDKPVLEFDFAGGFQMPLPKDFQRTPKLRVYADGKIVCGRSEPRFAEAVHQVSEREVIDLMEFIVNEHDIYQISSDVIQEKMQSTGRRMMVADAATTHFKINLKRGEHDCRVYAVDMMARQFKDVKELQSLLQIQQRLMKLFNRAQMGTQKRLDSILQTVNAALEKESAEIAKLTIDELQTATTFESGKFSANFMRNDKDEKGNLTNSVSVNYLLANPKAKPQTIVRITPFGNRK